MALVRLPQEALALLEDFICDAFTEAEFERVVREFVNESFVPQSSSRKEIVHLGIGVLIRHGCLDNHFFLRLRSVRPRRSPEIEFIRQQFVGSPSHGRNVDPRTRNLGKNSRQMIVSLALIGAGTIIMCAALLAHTELPGMTVFVCASVSAYLFGLAASDRLSFILARSHRRSLPASSFEFGSQSLAEKSTTNDDAIGGEEGAQ